MFGLESASVDQVATMNVFQGLFFYLRLPNKDNIDKGINMEYM